jgi:hypothetical protein
MMTAWRNMEEMRLANSTDTQLETSLEPYIPCTFKGFFGMTHH